jgi:hypothetical protein
LHQEMQGYLVVRNAGDAPPVPAAAPGGEAQK